LAVPAFERERAHRQRALELAKERSATGEHAQRGLRAGELDRLARLALAADLDNVPHNPDARERPYHQRRDVELPPAQAMRSRRREGVVVVVPGLPERWQREQEHVARTVGRREP